MSEQCGAYGWHDGNEYVCDRPKGHAGHHVDSWEGWEWSRDWD